MRYERRLAPKSLTRIGVLLPLVAGSLLLLASCSSEDAPPSTLLDDLSFEVPAERPVTRKDDPVDLPGAGNGQGLVEPVIVLGKQTGTPQSALVLDDVAAVYSANFRAADLNEAVSSILGTTLGLDYVIDPRVSGTFTLETAEPVTQRTLLGMLDTALSMNDAALMFDGQLVRVVPKEFAKSAGMPIGGGEIFGYGATVMPLRYAASGNVARTMAAVFPAEGAVVADEQRNTLILTGTADERRAMADLAGTLDVDWMAGKSVGLFPLRNTAAEPVARELEAVFADATGDVPTTFARFVPVERLSAVLAITSDPAQLAEAQAWISRLDYGNQLERSLRVYYVKNGKATDLASTLSKVFAIAGRVDSERTQQVGEAPLDEANARPLATDMTGDGIGSALTGEPVDSTIGADSTISTSTDALTPDGDAVTSQVTTTTSSAGPTGLRVVADAANNSLLIMASPAEHAAIENALQRLDILPMQVLIEATIAEVTLNDRLKYGVEYYFTNNPRGAIRGSGLSVAGLGQLLTTSIAPGLNLLIDTGNGPDVVITALSALTDVKVISSPQVVVQDNRTALLKVGDQVPVTIQQAVSIVTPDAPVVNSIQYVDTGVILKVTPRINAGGLVTCDIEQEVSSVSTDSLTGVLTPTISVRKVKSTVSVQSGQTVALGGLISETKNDIRTGLPILSRIPLFGALFGTQEEGTLRTELIVFITPRVIGSSEEARDVTLELKSRLQSLQRSATPKASPANPFPKSPSPPSPAPPPPPAD